MVETCAHTCVHFYWYPLPRKYFNEPTGDEDLSTILTVYDWSLKGSGNLFTPQVDGLSFFLSNKETHTPPYINLPGFTLICLRYVQWKCGKETFHFKPRGHWALVFLLSVAGYRVKANVCIKINRFYDFRRADQVIQTELSRGMIQHWYIYISRFNHIAMVSTMFPRFYNYKYCFNQATKDAEKMAKIRRKIIQASVMVKNY